MPEARPFRSPGTRETLATSTMGLGCPRCGGHNLVQKRHYPTIATGMFFGGLLLALCTYGLGLVLSFIALFITEQRGHCRACGWSWPI